jgi:hypothetical protein
MRPAERGSVLMLMPAAVMVMLVLGSIAVDFALVELRTRELHNAAAAAANDAATAGLAPEALRAGLTVIDPGRAARVVRRSLDARGISVVGAPFVAVADDGRTVTVALEADASYLFAGALPGARKSVRISARAAATALTADGS